MIDINHDAVNAIFECFGTLFILISARKCYINKSADGISWTMTAFFFVWGIWNIAFYPAIGQMFSFYAAIVMAIANFIYTSILIYYTIRRHNGSR